MSRTFLNLEHPIQCDNTGLATTNFRELTSYFRFRGRLVDHFPTDLCNYIVKASAEASGIDCA